MTRAIRPAPIWALHFMAIYAFISAACAPRQAAGHTTDAVFARITW